MLNKAIWTVNLNIFIFKHQMYYSQYITKPSIHIYQKNGGQMGGFIIVVLIKYTISGHHKVFDGSAANFGQQSIHAIQPT